VLATNLLVLLACKKYSAEPNVLTEFTSRTRALWSIPVPRATNHLPIFDRNNNSNNGITSTHLDYRVWWDTYYLGATPQSVGTAPIYSSTTFGCTGVARERVVPQEYGNSWASEIEEGGEYTYTHAYTQACNSCHPRVAGCRQRTWRSCVTSAYERFTAWTHASIIHAPFYVPRLMQEIQRCWVILHAESAIESCTTSVFHAPLEYTWAAGDSCHIGSGHNIKLCIRGQTVRDFVAPNRRWHEFPLLWELCLFYASSWKPSHVGNVQTRCPRCTRIYSGLLHDSSMARGLWYEQWSNGGVQTRYASSGCKNCELDRVGNTRGKEFCCLGSV